MQKAFFPEMGNLRLFWSKPKFLRYQESNLLIPKLFLRKRAFIYMTTAQEAGKPAPGAETSPLIDET